MARIILMYNKKILDQFELSQGDMKIGRRPGSEITIDNMAVSGEHANIFTIGEDSFIQDLGSTNGTLVNNKKITKHHLKNGDTITIGKHTLNYVNENEAEQPKPTDEFAKTVIITPASAGDDAGTQQKAGLYVLSGPNSGKRIEVSKRVTNLGRTGKRAGTITRTEEGFILARGDQDEAPKLNGRLIPENGAKLKNGDVIEVAGTRLQFQLK
ncbi:MAG: FHA domain-containing protein [Acidiferrobacterales bacterium]